MTEQPGDSQDSATPTEGDGDPIFQRYGCRKSSVLIGALGIGALLVIAAFCTNQEAADVVGLDLPEELQEVDVAAEQAPTDAAEAPDEQETPAITVSEVLITASTGETFPTTFTQANPDTVIIASPSLNVDESSLRPLIDSLTRGGCASFITFDSRFLSQTNPFEAYGAIIDGLDSLYELPDATFSTLGASATGVGALSAAHLLEGDNAFVMSMYDETLISSHEDFAPGHRIYHHLPPGLLEAFEKELLDDLQDRAWSKVDKPKTRIYSSEDDDALYDMIYDHILGHGFEGTKLPGNEHGTAIFEGPAGEQVIDEIAEYLLCDPD